MRDAASCWSLPAEIQRHIWLLLPLLLPPPLPPLLLPPLLLPLCKEEEHVCALIRYCLLLCSRVPLRNAPAPG